MFIPFYVAAVAVAVAGNIYDVIKTEQGIKAGVAVEASGTPKPTAVQLYVKNSPWFFGVALIPALAALVNPAVAFGFLTAPVVYGVKHYLGGREWQRLLDGGKPADPNAPLSAWQKFLRG